MEKTDLILLTGVSGYVGGQVLRVLQDRGQSVRCLVRDLKSLPDHLTPGTEVCGVDVLHGGHLSHALRGVHTAYYFIHSMSSVGDFESEDRRCARNFARVARAAGVKRIVYLGGLGDDRGGLSPHLRSRHEVGDILRASGVPVIEFRASVVIGAGSLSFELIRCLVQRLPIMVTPRWVNNPTQPIGIDDLLGYFLEALDLPEGQGGVFEIGGPDVVSYGELLMEYARQRHVKRLRLRVPVLSPRLSGLWLKLVTPRYARVGEKLIESLRNPTVVKEHAAQNVFSIQPRGMRETMAMALRAEDQHFFNSHWTEVFRLHRNLLRWGGAILGSRILDYRRIFVPVPPKKVFGLIERIGGKNGWYFGDVLWKIRGLLDRWVGGPGMRGRRDAHHLQVKDVVDFWRVEYVEPGQELLLFSELKLPGRAWLQFEITPEKGGCVIGQTALYDPMGPMGFLAWYILFPFHKIIFSGMIRALARKAMKEDKADG